jgi:hypothetical protein
MAWKLFVVWMLLWKFAQILSALLNSIPCKSECRCCYKGWKTIGRQNFEQYFKLKVLPSWMYECSLVNYRAVIGRHEDKIKYMGVCVYHWDNFCSICPQAEYGWWNTVLWQSQEHSLFGLHCDGFIVLFLAINYNIMVFM